ncbi:MAG: DUF6282 family protein, partial [Chloroflexota bacterium]
MMPEISRPDAVTPEGLSPPDRLLRGAIDCHVHIGPEPFSERRMDALALALEARKMGMRAIVAKTHHYNTAPLASLVNRLVPDFLLVGSLALNGATGGLDPEVVDAAVESGARVIWMPTYASTVDSQRRSEGGFYPVKTTPNVPIRPISLITPDGKLVPAMAPILESMKRGRAVLATGHISVPEIYAVVTAARKQDIPVIVTHPLGDATGSHLTLEQQRELAGQGAYLEYTFVPCMPSPKPLSPAVIVEHVKALGVAHCILTTDFGQAQNPPPPEGFRLMLATMLRHGFSEQELA